MKVGRPPMFNSKEELILSIEQYLNDQPNEPITITGLALNLGFESRQSFYDYEKKDDEFSYIIKRARLAVENSYEKRLANDKPTGAIFALKNMGWKDTQEIENKISGKLGITDITGMEVL